MILELILFEWLICKLEIGDIKLKKIFCVYTHNVNAVR